MLANQRATLMIPAKDVARAIAWYRDKLGVQPGRSDEYGAGYDLGGTRAFLYKSEYAGTAQSTLMSFDVADVAAEVAELRRRGVTPIDYDLPGLKTTDGIAEFGPVKNAWVKDSEGNIIGLVSGM